MWDTTWRERPPKSQDGRWSTPVYSQQNPDMWDNRLGGSSPAQIPAKWSCSDDPSWYNMGQKNCPVNAKNVIIILENNRYQIYDPPWTYKTGNLCELVIFRHWTSRSKGQWSSNRGSKCFPITVPAYCLDSFQPVMEGEVGDPRQSLGID